MARGRKQTKAAPARIKNRNGKGSVYKIGGNRRRPYIVRVTKGWQIIVDNDGNPKRRQLYNTIGYAETYEAGKQLLDDYNKHMDQGLEYLSNQITFGELYNKIIPRHIESYSNSAIKTYKAAEKRLQPLFDIPIVDLKTATLQSIIDNTYIKEQIGKRSLESIKTSMSLVFRYAEQNDIVSKNYADYTIIPKTAPQKPKHPFTPDEIKTLLDNDNIPYVDTILIMIYTGLRIDEMLKIRNADVYVDDRYLIAGSKTEAGKNRIIPIPHIIEGYIKKRYSTSNMYLVTEDGNRLSQNHYRSDIFKPILQVLGISSHTPHECRHTYASITDNAGINRVVQQRILGHKGTNITERVYIHKDLEALLAETDRVFDSQ